MRVALTFDTEHPDRPHLPGVQAEQLDLLRERRVRATFFLQGRWVEAFPLNARRIVADGHLIGSHSFYHARLPLLSDDGVRQDVRDAERAIREIAGADPRPWFRCPFFAGEQDPRIVGLLAELGYRNVPADVVLDDWDPARAGKDIAADALAACERVGDGAIVLLHSWPTQALEALPVIVDGLLERGATFADVAEIPADRWPSASGAARS